MLAVSLHLAMR